MELEEVKSKYLHLSSICIKLLAAESMDTQAGLMKYFNLSETEIPREIHISVTRLIANSEFIVLKEILNPGPNGPILSFLVMATSTVNKKKDKIFHSFNPKTAQGLPPASILRVTGDFRVLHATVKIEVITGSEDSKKTIIKNIYYGKEFVLEL